MDIPAKCKDWEVAMASKPETCRILDNLRNDPCVPRGTSNAFFDKIADQGSPADADRAKATAHNIVTQGPDNFVCCGQEVPVGIFTELFRFESVEHLRYRIHDELDKRGLIDQNLADLEEEDLRDITDDYDGPVALGNPVVVWATDFEHVRPHLDGPKMLSARLGREMPAEEAYCIVCVYNRDDTGRTLHVPRSLDAVNMPEFEVGTNCSANHGMTKPLLGATGGGIPEAVHRDCMLTPIRWEMRPVA